jgi:hypothetical protein
MKKLALLMLIAFSLPIVACSSSGSETSNTETAIKPAKVEVFYFHYTRRCVTCNAVEQVTKDALNEFYGDKVKKGEITFQSVNIEEKDGEAIANKLKVAGQALIFLVNGKQVDLTDAGFMYAKSNPDKLKTEIKKTIDPALK